MNGRRGTHDPTVGVPVLLFVSRPWVGPGPNRLWALNPITVIVRRRGERSDDRFGSLPSVGTLYDLLPFLNMYHLRVRHRFNSQTLTLGPLRVVEGQFCLVTSFNLFSNKWMTHGLNSVRNPIHDPFVFPSTPGVGTPWMSRIDTLEVFHLTTLFWPCSVSDQCTLSCIFSWDVSFFVERLQYSYSDHVTPEIR